MCSTFPELCGLLAVGSFHLTISVLDKVWIISDTRLALCHTLWRQVAHTSGLSLLVGPWPPCMPFSMPGIGLSTSRVGADYHK